jgi:ligand-binding SRPBCC domain-containing protein
MPKFLVERRFHVGESEMPEVSRRSKRTIIEQFPEITWEHSHVVVDGDGTVLTYCVYDSPDETMLRAHAADLGNHTIDGIHEIAGDVTPADFPG